MADRDRLINELKKAKNKCLIYESGSCLACKYRGQADCTLENLADHLLENGVICPPCKVGDRYVMDTAKTIFNAWNDVTGAVVNRTSWYYELESVIEDIVKLSFGAGVLYREEVENSNLTSIKVENKIDKRWFLGALSYAFSDGYTFENKIDIENLADFLATRAKENGEEELNNDR